MSPHRVFQVLGIPGSFTPAFKETEAWTPGACLSSEPAPPIFGGPGGIVRVLKNGGIALIYGPTQQPRIKAHAPT